MLKPSPGDTPPDLRLRALIVLAGLSGCSSTTLGGVKVVVRFLDTDAQCAQVFVAGTNNLTQTSAPLKRSALRDRVVGIAQDDNTGPVVNLQAKGFLASDCSGPAMDFSKVEHREFFAGDALTPVLLVLKGGATPDAGGRIDAGPTGDGGLDGGPDAGGGSGADAGPEQCGNGIDDDQDGLTDCLDGDCLRQDCLFGRRCTSVGVCEVPATELSCSDGLDDDNDGAADCKDPDCNNKSCSDGNSCTYAETCQATVCTPATTLTCASPNACQMGSGTCLADAGCGYAEKSGSCDGGTCMGGECIIGFPFVPSNGFNPAIPASAVVPTVKLDCGVSTFDSDTLVFGNWCNQPKPLPRILNRLGVQNIVVLPMAGLNLVDELRLTGSQPVILAVYGDASITGKLVASAKGPASGAGGPAGNCLGFGEPGFTFIFSGGGGGGAGFAQAGTKGGNSNGNLLAGGPGGLTFGLSPLLQLRGGCQGGDGASGLMGQQAALGGGAGGAVQLSVSGILTVDGKVSANGGFGAGGVTFNAGGGGGGSGGGILLEANLVQLLGGARLTANGGGGGGGARNNDDGQDGDDGHDNDESAAKGGANGGGEAGNGGKGGSIANPTNAEDGTTSAGGGGGAGVGRIHLRSILACAVNSGRKVSPAATGDCL